MAALVADSDSFFIATVTPEGWPYLQHRGGPRGFVHVLNATTIAFAEFVGNQQYVTIGNLDVNDRVALLFVEYPTRTRVKVFGRATTVERSEDPAFVERLLQTPGGPFSARAERAIVIAVEASDQNCRKDIPLKYSEESVHERIRLARADLLEESAALRDGIQELQRQLNALTGVE